MKFVVISRDKETGAETEETRRTDRKAAEQDVEIFKTLGRTAWIVETDAA